MSYRFDINYLLSLDILALDRLLEVSKKVKNAEIAESAIAVRNAMNADPKEFKTFLAHYSNETEDQVESQKLVEGRAALKRLFGGGS